MAEPKETSNAAKKLLSEFKDQGVTDLDSLVRKIVENKEAPAQARHIWCNPNYCVIVRPWPPDRESR